MTTMTVKMPESLSLRLRNEAAGSGVNCSELIRRAIEKMLKAGDQTTEGTCLFLALILPEVWMASATLPQIRGT